LKASNAEESRPLSEYVVPQEKFDQRPREDQARCSEVQTEIKGGRNGPEDPFQMRLPKRRDKPWLVVGIAGAFAVMFAGFFYSALK